MIKKHLLNNSGDENISKMIWVLIIFLIGTTLFVMIQIAFSGKVSDIYNNLVSNIFSDDMAEKAIYSFLSE